MEAARTFAGPGRGIHLVVVHSSVRITPMG